METSVYFIQILSIQTLPVFKPLFHEMLVFSPLCPDVIGSGSDVTSDDTSGPCAQVRRVILASV